MIAKVLTKPLEVAKRDVLAAETTAAAAEFRRTAFRLRVRRNLQKLKEVRRDLQKLKEVRRDLQKPKEVEQLRL